MVLEAGTPKNIQLQVKKLQWRVVETYQFMVQRKSQKMLPYNARPGGGVPTISTKGNLLDFTWNILQIIMVNGNPIKMNSVPIRNRT